MSTTKIEPGQNTLYPVDQLTKLALTAFEDDPSGRALVQLADPAAIYEDDWTEAEDLLTGRMVQVRRADCGLGCKCAGEVKLA